MPVDLAAAELLSGETDGIVQETQEAIAYLSERGFSGTPDTIPKIGEVLTVEPGLWSDVAHLPIVIHLNLMPNTGKTLLMELLFRYFDHRLIIFPSLVDLADAIARDGGLFLDLFDEYYGTLLDFRDIGQAVKADLIFSYLRAITGNTTYFAPLRRGGKVDPLIFHYCENHPLPYKLSEFGSYQLPQSVILAVLDNLKINIHTLYAEDQYLLLGLLENLLPMGILDMVLKRAKAFFPINNEINFIQTLNSALYLGASSDLTSFLSGVKHKVFPPIAIVDEGSLGIRAYSDAFVAAGKAPQPVLGREQYIENYLHSAKESVIKGTCLIAELEFFTTPDESLAREKDLAPGPELIAQGLEERPVMNPRFLRHFYRQGLAMHSRFLRLEEENSLPFAAAAINAQGLLYETIQQALYAINRILVIAGKSPLAEPRGS